MPFKRPTLPELANEAQQDLAARLNAFGRLRRNVIDVLARVWAGLANGLYGYIGYLAKQLFQMTAESFYLDRKATWWGINRKGSAKAIGQAHFTGVAGSDVPAGALLSSTGGQRFVTQEGGTLSADGRLSLTIKAESGGAASNLDPGVKLRLINPYGGVKPEATVGEEGVSGGVDSESDDQLRARLLERVQEPPQGGTAHDYVAWAKEVDGVSRAWAYGTLLGPGTVSVTFVCDDQSDPIPTPEKVAEVQAYLNDPIRRPITADVVVYQLQPFPVPITIQGLDPDTEAVRAEVVKELAAMFTREAEPGEKILVSHIREAISHANGEYDHVLVSPEGNLIPGVGHLPVLGEVLFE